ncbi:MAG: cytochrome c-type biogenesis protein [Burkholderiales bacterium]
MHRFLLLLILVCVTASAQVPATEARMARLTEQLRCLVCQNQTLEDSNADLAVDLRREIRVQIERGASDQEILDYLVQRYGEFVLYRPRLKAETALLWFAPLLFVLAGGTALIITLRRRKTRVKAITAETHKQAMALLVSEDRGQRTED